MLFIEEQGERAEHPEQTAVINDFDFRTDLKDRGLDVRVYDKDQKAAVPYKKIVDTYPSMIIMESSDEYRVFPVPKTVEEAEQIIRKNVVR